MFWRDIVYILVGLVVLFLVLPVVLALVADLIHRYLGLTTSSPSDFLDAKPQDSEGKVARHPARRPNEPISEPEAPRVELFSVSRPARETSDIMNAEESHSL